MALLLVAFPLAGVLGASPDPPPVSGVCPLCGGEILPIHYGLLTLQDVASSPQRLEAFANGRAYFRHHDQSGQWLEGGCAIIEGAPGWLCGSCGRTWEPVPCSHETHAWIDRFWALFR